MSFSMQVGFNKGFFNYRKALEKQFNDNLVLTLESYYQEYENWDTLTRNKQLWHELISQSSTELVNDGRFRQPPPRQLPRPQMSRPMKRRAHENHDKPSPNRRLRNQQLPPMILLDKEKEFIVGMRVKNHDSISFSPIKHNNLNVGYLGIQQDKSVHFKQDKIFTDNIKKMLFKMGLLMIVIAVFVTFPIAKYFTRLINQITDATKKVAAGDFSTRIKTDRKDELGDLAEHFNLLAKSLESNSESQKRIIADIAHELRTPISVIVGEIEAIQDGIHTANENTMSLLHSQISSLKNLVNDLHDLSESDLGSLKYQMQRFDLLKLLEQCYQNHKLSFSQKNISLILQSTDKPCFILGDTNRLNQLFNNVLSNSMQYTEDGGRTEIEIKCHESFIEVKISDSGPGINIDQLDKIFDRWYRGEKSRNKNSGGSGLGLSICKEIVKAHNGEIHAFQSQLGGIEIFIKLPKTGR